MKIKIKLFKEVEVVWPLLLANMIYYLGIGMSEAVVWQEIYAVLSPRLLSLNSAIGWCVGVVLGIAWSKFGKRLSF